MASLSHDPLIDRLLASAGWINALLIAATAAAGAIVLIKVLTKRDEFKVFGVDLPVGRAWLIFGLFTIGHAYSSYVFRQDCALVMTKSADVQNDAWNALTGASLLFFHGLVSRLKYVQFETGQRVFLMDESDPTTWLVHGVALLAFVAIVRVRRVSWGKGLGTVFAGLIIITSNWLIGGGWAVTASLLSQRSGH